MQPVLSEIARLRKGKAIAIDYQNTNRYRLVIQENDDSKAVLHMPKLNYSKVELSAYKVAARFCSFGSTWDNKLASVASVSDSSSNNGYQNIDLTPLLINPQTKTIAKSEGLILKPQIKGSGFSAITTADSYFAPQILEINFK